MSESPTSLVERMLAERIGLDPSSVGEALIARGVRNRMAVLGLRSREEYDRALVERGDEVQALVEEVVVPESWFFRDERPFEVVAEFAGRGWLTGHDRPPLAALSIPCAGGEEPYSIAITLLEAGLPAGRFRVDAVDVSARSLARAIAGVYGPNAFRGEGSAARSGHFRESHGAFAVEPAVRSCVRFHLGNLLDPALFADRPAFDVVFCRNLLIYLDDEAKGRAFATLARLVGEGGLLLLGHADRLDVPEAAPFRATADRGAFAYRKGEPPAKPGPVSPSPLTPVAAKVSPGKPTRPPVAVAPVSPGKRGDDRPEEPAIPPRPAAVGRGDDGAGAAGRAPAGFVSAEPASALLDRASALADLGRYGEASALVEAAILGGGAGARGYFLLGLIAQAAGHRDRAEGHLLKAIYLDPQHDEALLALALLARRKGDIAGESAYRKRAGRVLSRRASP